MPLYAIFQENALMMYLHSLKIMKVKKTYLPQKNMLQSFQALANCCQNCKFQKALSPPLVYFCLCFLAFTDLTTGSRHFTFFQICHDTQTLDSTLKAANGKTRMTFVKNHMSKSINMTCPARALQASKNCSHQQQ